MERTPMWILVKVKKSEDVGVDEERRLYLDKVDIVPHPTLSPDNTPAVCYIVARGFDRDPAYIEDGFCDLELPKEKKHIKRVTKKIDV